MRLARGEHLGLGRRRTLDLPAIKQIQKGFAAGRTQEQLADDYGVHVTTIQQHTRFIDRKSECAAPRKLSADELRAKLLARKAAHV